MTKYVELETAIDAVNDVYYDTPDINLSADKLEAALRGIQYSDVVPVVHGRWIEHKKYIFGTMYDCSVCYNRILDNGHAWNYCPNCVARMDGDDDG